MSNIEKIKLFFKTIWHHFTGFKEVALECESCNWQQEETDCKWCKGSGIAKIKTYLSEEKLYKQFKVLWTNYKF